MVEECIGGDEAGKGDVFGPLVVVAAYGGKERVRDSKLLSDRAIMKAFESLKEVPHEVRVVMPVEYNKLYQRFGNLNKLLAHLYREVLDKLRAKVGEKPICIDKFGAFSYPGATVVEKAESKCPCVALASMLARAYFLKGLRELEERYNIDLPKGAAHVDVALKAFVERYGTGELGQVAKLHFKNVKRLLNERGSLKGWL